MADQGTHKLYIYLTAVGFVLNLQVIKFDIRKIFKF